MKLIIVLLLTLSIMGCDGVIRGGPKPIKIWPAKDLEEFQDKGIVTAERRPVEEVESENAMLREKVESLKAENMALSKRLSDPKDHVSFQETADHIRLHDSEINALWSAFHRLEERVKSEKAK